MLIVRFYAVGEVEEEECSAESILSLDKSWKE